MNTAKNNTTKTSKQVDAAVRKHGYTLVHKVVSASRIHENAWNPNEMDEMMFKKLKNGITMFGFVDPVLVRKRKGGGYEIIDGEHRLKAMKELGHKKIAIKCIRESVSDVHAQALTLTCNEVRGRHDVLAEAEMIEVMNKSNPLFLDDEQGVLPYSKRDAEIMMDLLKPFDVHRFDGAKPPSYEEMHKDAFRAFLHSLIRTEQAGQEYHRLTSDAETKPVMEQISRSLEKLKQLAKDRKKTKRKEKK